VTQSYWSGWLHQAFSRDISLRTSDSASGAALAYRLLFPPLFRASRGTHTCLGENATPLWALCFESATRAKGLGCALRLTVTWARWRP
jgi:hypothetical protein